MRRRWESFQAALTVRVNAARERSAPADIAVESVQRYRRHRLGRSAALLAHYGFLSVFPLLVCFTTILGFVLQGDPKLQERIVDSALGHLPVIGQQLRADPAALRGSGWLLALSLLTAIWAGLRAFVVAHTAIDDIDEVPERERRSMVKGRLRALAAIGLIGLSQVLTAVVAGALSASPLAGLTQAALLTLTAALDVALIAITYQLLSSRNHAWRALAVGAVPAGILFAGLQVFGSLVVGRAITRATPVYGTFAAVIGMLSWFAVHATVALVAFQLVVVLEARRGEAPVS